MKTKSLDEQLTLFTEPLSDYDKDKLAGKTTSSYSTYPNSSYPSVCTGRTNTTEITVEEAEEMAAQNDYNPDVGLWNFDREEFVFVPLREWVDFQTSNKTLDEEAMSRAFFKTIEENYDIVPMHQDINSKDK